MSLDTAAADSPLLRGVDELVDSFSASGRPDGPLLLGLEHEKLLFPMGSAGPVGFGGERGIGALLERFCASGWTPFREAADLPVIACTRGAATVSFEPGGQLEFSGSPFPTAREAHAENLAHLAELKKLAAELGLRVVTLGYRPFGKLEDMPWMTKTRYQLMRGALGARGTHAHHMMLMTATGQVSLDWRDEADCRRKIDVAVRATPALVAMFANSPVVEGHPSGWRSFRSRVWNDVDLARCGYPDCMLDGSFSFRAYVEWALDVPMLFHRRGDRYVGARTTFRRFLADGAAGLRATVSDWVDHLSTLFPEVRVKRVIELRCADGNDAALTGALAALLRALLYDDAAGDEVRALVSMESPSAHRALHRDAQRLGLDARWGDGTLLDAARELVAIAGRALERVDPADAPLLEPLRALVAAGKSPAERVLEAAASGEPPEVWLRRFEV